MNKPTTLIQEIIAKLTELQELFDDEGIERDVSEKSEIEMLTVKQCRELIKGVSATTIRRLVADGEIRHIRTGDGNRGKVLINKKDFLDYFNAV